MAQKSITFSDKSNRIPVGSNREEKIVAEDVNEIKEIVNENADDAENRISTVETGKSDKPGSAVAGNIPVFDTGKSVVDSGKTFEDTLTNDVSKIPNSAIVKGIEDRVSINEADIATNQGDIATSQGDISTNQANITSNTGRITDNEVNITTLFNSLNGYLPQGEINIPADFPTLGSVQVGHLYSIGSNVTDNDVTKTNTGLSFLAGVSIVWSAELTWIDLGSNYVTTAQKNKIDTGSNFVKTIIVGEPVLTGAFESATVLPLEDGTYTNFNSLERLNELCVFVYEGGAWVKKTIDYKATTDTIKNEAVRFEKTDFITTGNNLFNKDNATLDYYIKSSNGTVVSSADWWHSDYIPVKPSTIYSAINKVRDRAYYDENKVFISGAFDSVNQLTTPVNTAYVRYSQYTLGSEPNLPEDSMFNEGSELLPVEPYLNKFKYEYEDLEGVLDEFNPAVEYDSVSEVIGSSANVTREFADIAGVGAIYNLSGQTFNAILLPSAKRGSVANDRLWSYAQVIIKNAKEDSVVIAKSPLIPVSGLKTELTDLIFPLMNNTLTELITLNDASFSGATYFVAHVWYNADLSYAYGGTTEGVMSNYGGDSYYTTNNNLTTWVGYSGDPSIGLEHILLVNPSIYQNLTRLDKRITDLEQKTGELTVQLPEFIDMTIGDTLQMYYSSMISFPHWDKYHFAATLPGAKDLRRYLEYIPVSTGDKVLTIAMQDEFFNTISQCQTTIKVRAAVQQPVATVNFWTVGDSWTNNPIYTDEMVRRLTGTGGTPVGLGYSNIVNHREGNSGKEWNWYATNEDSPFVYSGVLDLEQYRIDNGLPVPQAIYIVLTWNGMGTNRSQGDWDVWDDDVYSIVDAMKAAFPSVQIKLCSPGFPSQNGGLGAVDGANINGYPNILLQNRNILKQAEIYERISNEVSYSSFTEHVNIALVMDSLYNIDAPEKPVNTRNPILTERIGSNDVHPNTYGYYQVADALFRNFIKNYCQ